MAVHLDAMLAAQELGVPLLNGYSGSEPLNFQKFFYDLDESSMRDWLMANDHQDDDITIADNVEAAFDRADFITLSMPDGRFLSVEPNQDSWARADEHSKRGMHYFRLIELSDGRVALLAANMRFICAEILEEAQLSTTGIELGDFGKFRWQQLEMDRGCATGAQR